MTINIKENSDPELPYSFEITCPKLPKPIILIADCQKNHIEWISSFKNSIESYLSKDSKKDENVNFDKLVEAEDNYCGGEVIKNRLIKNILKKNSCADCDGNEPCWISLNLGVLLCLECSGIHRKMGPSISKIR